MNGVSDDAIKLRLFPFTLRDKARFWISALKENSIRNWDEMVKAFLNKFFPPRKTALIRKELTSFRQKDNEPLSEAWERFRNLQITCPHHGLPDWLLIQIFYDGLNATTQIFVDVSAGGSFMNRNPEEAQNLIEDMAANNWPAQESVMGREGALQLNFISRLVAKLDAMQVTLERMHVKTISTNQPKIHNCMDWSVTQRNNFTEQVYSIDGVQPGNQENSSPMNHSNDNRNNPNFQWRQDGQNGNFNQNRPTYQQQFQQQGMYMDQRMWNYILNLGEMSSMMMEQLSEMNKKLEILFGERNDGSNNGQTSGKMLTQLETNPRGEVNSVATRSGVVVKGSEMPKEELEKQNHSSARTQPSTDRTKETISSSEKQNPYSARTQPSTVRNKSISSHGSNSEEDSTEPTPEPTNPNPNATPIQPPKPYQPPVPFPQRLQKNILEDQFQKFVQVLKQSNATIPFTDALTRIPNYAKFLKDILANKRKMDFKGTVMLTEQCSAVLQNHIPMKQHDPGKFSIPVTIGKTAIKKALLDLGASVSLMPKSVFDKIQVGDLKPTRISLQLADSTIRLPLGIVEDVPVQIGKFFIPGDFVVMEMEEDKNVPIILGRPFLKTAGALIDVRDGIMTLRIGDEKVEFQLDKTIKSPSKPDSCCMIEYIDPLSEQAFRKEDDMWDWRRYDQNDSFPDEQLFALNATEEETEILKIGEASIQIRAEQIINEELSNVTEEQGDYSGVSPIFAIT